MAVKNCDLQWARTCKSNVVQKYESRFSTHGYVGLYLKSLEFFNFNKKFWLLKTEITFDALKLQWELLQNFDDNEIPNHMNHVFC